MTTEETKAIIIKAKAGMLTQEEQVKLAEAMDLALKMMLRLERALHDLIKEAEDENGTKPV